MIVFTDPTKHLKLLGYCLIRINIFRLYRYTFLNDTKKLLLFLKYFFI